MFLLCLSIPGSCNVLTGSEIVEQLQQIIYSSSENGIPDSTLAPWLTVQSPVDYNLRQVVHSLLIKIISLSSEEKLKLTETSETTPTCQLFQFSSNAFSARHRVTLNSPLFLVNQQQQ